MDQITEEHMLLYRKYMDSRHRNSPMARYHLVECQQFMQADWCNTIFLEFRSKRQLLAVAVVDLIPGSLSAVYTYFHPDHYRRALGVHAILRQIELAQQLRLNWLYLGFWISNCTKMNYKVNYQPFELKIDNSWHYFDQPPRRAKTPNK